MQDFVVPEATTSKGPPLTKPASRACDACAFRRVRCDQTDPCLNCTKRNLTCSYVRPVRKRGPAGSRLERLRASAGTSPSTGVFSLHEHSPSTSALTLEALHEQPFAENGQGTADVLENWDGWLADTSNYQSLPSVSGSLLASLAMPNLTSEAELGLSPHSEASPGSSNLLAMDGFDMTAQSVPAFAPSNVLSAGEQSNLLEDYFKHLAPTIPVFSQAYITKRLLSGEAQHNPDFAALLLAMCAVVHVQPLAASELSDPEKAEAKRQKAAGVVDEVLRLRAGATLGENASLDQVMTSFLTFAALFGLQLRSAAWLRLQEAINIAQLMGIDDQKTYVGLDAAERERRRRCYCSLAITERAFAVQHRHQTAFKGQITYPDAPGGEPDGADLFLTRHMRLFGAVDSSFLLCWSGNCPGAPKCKNFGVQDALALDQKLADESSAAHMDEDDPSATLSIQQTDLNLTQLWLRNRLWTLSLDHDLVSFSPEKPGLDGMIAFRLARSAADLCQSVPMSVLEALGVSAAEKLYELAEALAELCTIEPSPPSLDGEGGRRAASQLISRYAILLSTFRAGQHKYLPLMKTLQERTKQTRSASFSSASTR